MRLLDLFSGAGGASAGYAKAGFVVYGVDREPHPSYPFAFHEGDALDVLARLLSGAAVAFYTPADLFTEERCEMLTLADFVAVVASPPCQRYCTATGPGRDRHPDLVGPVRELLESTGLPYVIENVPQAPLRDPAMLCGSAFGLDVRRHRVFESNMPIVGTACQHARQGRPVGVYGQHPDGKRHLRPDGTERGTKATSLEHGQRAMGIDWMGWDDLVEAIPPAYSEFIGSQLAEHLSERVA